MLLDRSQRGRGVLALLLLIFASPLSAQSVTSGAVSGTVRGSDFRPVAQALVTLRPLGAGIAYEVTTSSTGSFSVGIIQPGSYEIRVEALGYRPLVARVLTVSGGDARSVSLTLNAATPPVTQIDTIGLGGASSTRWRPGGMQFGGTELDYLPSRFEDVASVASLSTAFDESFGAQGLPGDMTLIVADGLPFYRAPHPSTRQELLPDALFPRSALAGAAALHNASDVEWSGSAGGYLTLSTRTSTGSPLEVEGAYSGSPVWNSQELDIDKPSLLSFLGGARGTVSISPSTRLVMSGEGMSQQTPLAPRASADLVADLGGLDPELLSSLSGPGVETYDRYSGLMRLDLRRSRATQMFFRGLGSFSRRQFTDAGPVTMAGPAALAEESVDFSAGFGVVNQYSRTAVLEFRTGVSGSYRDFGPSLERAVSPGYLVSSGAVLGDMPSSLGASSRTDFVMIPVFRWKPGAAGFKAGATIRASTHSMDYSMFESGDYLYSDPAALLAARGYGAVGAAPKADFGTQEYGVFAQYESPLTTGLHLRLGGRYDYERIGGDGVPLNTDLQTVTGVRNDDVNDAYHQFGLRGSLTWDPIVGGGTRIVVAGSLHEGDVDPRAVARVYAESTDATSTRYTGTGLDWPDAAIPPLASPSLPSLTLLGPDTRAPRTTNLEVGVVQRLGAATSVFARGSTRRTDFLMRRRNLNIPLVPQALDPSGRRIYGTLAQDGSMVTATGDDARRFPQFGEIWALDPDGWSEYVGVTVGLEHVGSNFDVYGSYTYSETTDNWVGASTGSLDAELRPGLPTVDGSQDWSEGTSDFDVPHRLTAVATARAGRLALSTSYRFRSGTPFTPRYRTGVDANGDGSNRNDVAFVPTVDQLGGLPSNWSCLADQAGGFAARNSCRTDARHALDARVTVTLGSIGDRAVHLALDGFNLVEGGEGVIDDALLLTDPSGTITTSPDGATVTIPTLLNDDFGTVLYPSSRGRMLRISVRVGG